MRPQEGEAVTRPLATVAQVRPPAFTRPARLSPTLLACGVAALLLAASLSVLLLARGGSPAPVAQVIGVPGHPTGIAVTPGRVWVAAQRTGTVQVLDSATGRAVGAPLHTGGTPARLAVGASGVWVADTARGAVVPVRWRPTPKVFPPIELGADVTDVTLAARAVWVASSAEGVVRVLEPGAERAAHEVPVGANPVALASDDRWVVAAAAGSGTIARIDARTRRLAGPPLRVGGVPVAVAVTGGIAWVADARGTVTAVDLARGAATRPIEVGAEPAAVAADGEDVYVATRRELVHLRDGEVKSRQAIGGEPAAVALGERHVWVADAGGNRVVRLER
jgi:DNA-binding beta-propeller fold protein YncE